MSAYLYPELLTKKAYKEAIAAGKKITAFENTPWGNKRLIEGSYSFEGPHYPKPHRYYGKAVVKDGIVISIK
jgi:hypothetical protein